VTSPSVNSASGESSTTEYDADGEVIETTDADGRTVTYSYDQLGDQTGQSLLNAAGGAIEITTFTYDSDGEMTGADNPSATETFTYDPFGNIVTQTNATDAVRFGFAGMEFDSVTGLYYDHARYYDAAIGRFTSQDPKSFAAGDANLYRYVGNDPTGIVDTSGDDCGGGVSGGLGGATSGAGSNFGKLLTVLSRDGRHCYFGWIWRS
jgi:RHS repeat-associated protein